MAIDSEPNDTELTTDGGTEQVLTADELAELAAEYRDALLRELGIVGIEHASSGRDFEHIVRKNYPVERAASMARSFNGVGNSRLLYDISGRDDGGETVSGHEESRFATVRETTGYAAIQSSATLTLCWKHLPTPREILVAEYLEALDGRDLSPEQGVSEGGNVAERLIGLVFDDRVDKLGETPPLPWLGLADTTLDNVAAIEHHVAGAIVEVDGRDNYSIETIRFDRERGRDAEDGPFSRWSVGFGMGAALAVESYSTDWGKRHDRVFGTGFGDFGDPASEEWHELSGLTTDGWGYIEGEITPEDIGANDDHDASEVRTRIVCVPECRHPSEVLDADELGVDLDRAAPNTPLAGPRDE